jgi:pimeloyl-ACP methyl ester carboxylesterase
MVARVAVWPKKGSPVSLRTALREAALFARNVMEPPVFPEDAPRGNGRPVVVLPGFFTQDTSTARLRSFLTQQDFCVHVWGQGVNIGPTKLALAGLERRLEEVAERYGVAPALIGQSLGGTIAREAAKRRPDLVSHVVTIVSPIRLPVPTTLAPLAQCAALVWDRSARTAMGQLADPPPMKLTAIVAQNDGLIDARSCIPDPAPNVEVIFVDGIHTAMGSNPIVQRIVAARLAE